MYLIYYEIFFKDIFYRIYFVTVRIEFIFLLISLLNKSKLFSETLITRVFE